MNYYTVLNELMKMCCFFEMVYKKVNFVYSWQLILANISFLYIDLVKCTAIYQTETILTIHNMSQTTTIYYGGHTVLDSLFVNLEIEDYQIAHQSNP